VLVHEDTTYLLFSQKNYERMSSFEKVIIKKNRHRLSDVYN